MRACERARVPAFERHSRRPAPLAAHLSHETALLRGLCGGCLKHRSRLLVGARGEQRLAALDRGCLRRQSAARMARLGAFDSLCLDTPYDSEYPG